MERRLIRVRRSREEAFETRTKILESALDTMSEKPFSQVSMNEIAQKIDLSKGAVYWHFRDRNDLLLNLVENLCNRAGEEFGFCAEEPPETPEKIRSYFEGKLKQAVQSTRFKRMHRLLMRRYEWPEEVREKVRALMFDRFRQESAMLEKFLRALREEGRIRDDISTAELAPVITSVFQGLFIAQISELSPPDLTKYVPFIFHALTLTPWNGENKSA